MDYQNYTKEELIKEIDKLKEENKKLKNLLDLHGISIKDSDNEFKNLNKNEKIIYFGDLNPFMFKKDDSESLLRIIDKKYAKSLTHEIGADDVLFDLRVEE